MLRNGRVLMCLRYTTAVSWVRLRDVRVQTTYIEQYTLQRAFLALLDRSIFQVSADG